jgi:septal ring factor EnvC (AmiA/AmiB activator)
MTTPKVEHDGDAGSVEAEMRRLDDVNAQLQSALDDLEHDMRRCTDALERAGWQSGELEGRMSTLRGNRRIIMDEQERNRGTHARLGQRLATLREQAGGSGDRP